MSVSLARTQSFADEENCFINLKNDSFHSIEVPNFVGIPGKRHLLSFVRMISKMFSLMFSQNFL